MKGVGGFSKSVVPHGVGTMATDGERFGVGKLSGSSGGTDKKASLKAHEDLGKLMQSRSKK